MYELKNNEQGICPYCENEDIEHKVFQLDEQGDGYYPVFCNECKKEYREYYSLKFEGNYITSIK